jgi:two-component system NtrC family response regulator
MRRAWPGNVRELANFCQRTILLRLSDTLDEAGMLPSDEALTGPAPVTSSNLLGELPEDHMSLPGLERELIVRALAKQGGNRTRTAEYLGIPRHVLLYRMEKFAIE